LLEWQVKLLEIAFGRKVNVTIVSESDLHT
jgi:hypothetical protein